MSEQPSIFAEFEAEVQAARTWLADLPDSRAVQVYRWLNPGQQHEPEQPQDGPSLPDEWREQGLITDDQYAALTGRRAS